MSARHYSNAHQRAVCEFAEGAGWAVTISGGGHFAFEKAGRPTIYASRTPSCRFATRKAIADIKRADRAAMETE